MSKVTVTHYTDPWSVWCWAIEPQLLRLRERHAEAIDFRVRIGAILETPVPKEVSREPIVRMFHAAKRQSGMPLDADLVLKVHSGTTMRAGIAAKAVALVDPPRFERYLRALRVASQVEAVDIEQVEVQERLAQEVGVELAAFREAMESEEATRELYSDQTEMRVRGVTGFPTVTFRGPRGAEVAVGGFQPTEAYEEALARANGSRLVDGPAPDVLDLLRRRGPLATAEVAEVYDALEDRMALELFALERAGSVVHAERAGGLFWSAR
ncbi:MAG TPA: DsbA family protein [Candidatus Thermoplasmatota archaeon]|nr:DsbA family protein [Candidatus Thermoplasmatota archaeon]